HCHQHAVAAGRRRWGIHTHDVKGLLIFLNTGHRETGESNPSYTTCPLCWQSFSASRDTFSEDGSPNGTDVQRMNSSKPGSEKTNARLMFSLPVFVRLTHVSAGMKTIAPACTSRSCVPSHTCALPV